VIATAIAVGMKHFCSLLQNEQISLRQYSATALPHTSRAW